MNLRLHAINKQPFTEFVEKISAKWQLGMQRTQPETSIAKTPEEILRDLIAMPTVVGNTEAISNSLDYVETFLKRCGMYVERPSWGGVETLVATTTPTKTPTVFLAGHIDVVPATPEFMQLQEKDGKYYGRGVLDMKGAIAAYLSVVQELGDRVQNYDFGIMIMTDEEIGGFDGAANLAKAGYLPKVLVLPDGGNADWSIERFAKGIWHITIEASGKSAHGSRPWEGSNAIDTLTQTISEIKALFPNMSETTNTFNVGIITGGKAINQIPAKATASIDMRFSSIEEQRRIHQEVTEILQKNNVRLTIEIDAEPLINDPENEYLAAYAQCTSDITGKPAEWVISKAGNDGRWFAPYGVACAISYPPGGNHHGAGEWIEKRGYEQLQQIIADYLHTVARNKT